MIVPIFNEASVSLFASIYAYQLPIQLLHSLNGCVNATSQRLGIWVDGADDDSTMGRLHRVQTHKMPAIVGQDGPVIADGKRQHVAIR